MELYKSILSLKFTPLDSLRVPHTHFPLAIFLDIMCSLVEDARMRMQKSIENTP